MPVIPPVGSLAGGKVVMKCIGSGPVGANDEKRAWINGLNFSEPPPYTQFGKPVSHGLKDGNSQMFNLWRDWNERAPWRLNAKTCLLRNLPLPSTATLIKTTRHHKERTQCPD